MLQRWKLSLKSESKKNQKKNKPVAVATAPNKPLSLRMMHLLIKAEAIIYLTGFLWEAGRGRSNGYGGWANGKLIQFHFYWFVCFSLRRFYFFV